MIAEQSNVQTKRRAIGLLDTRQPVHICAQTNVINTTCSISNLSIHLKLEVLPSQAKVTLSLIILQQAHETSFGITT